MRIAVLLFLIAFLCVYAYRDWFKSLCGLIVMMAVMQHPDMPEKILGIQGLNPWNVLMANVLAGWLLARQREGLVWDLPRAVRTMLLLYLIVIIIGFARMMLDRSYLDAEFTTGYLVSEYFINCVKWVLPAMLLFDGCRSRPRFKLALISILVVYVLLAAQVIRWMPFGLSGAELTYRSRKLIQNEIGFH